MSGRAPKAQALRVPTVKAPPRPIADPKGWAKFERPSKSDAAWFLRQLSLHDLEPAWKIRLHLIAECIEGTARWHKPLVVTPTQEIEIETYARMVDRRERGICVADALDAVARNYAARHQVDAEKARERIFEARRRLRKLGK